MHPCPYTPSQGLYTRALGAPKMLLFRSQKLGPVPPNVISPPPINRQTHFFNTKMFLLTCLRCSLFSQRWNIDSLSYVAPNAKTICNGGRGDVVSTESLKATIIAIKWDSRNAKSECKVRQSEQLTTKHFIIAVKSLFHSASKRSNLENQYGAAEELRNYSQNSAKTRLTSRFSTDDVIGFTVSRRRHDGDVISYELK